MIGASGEFALLLRSMGVTVASNSTPWLRTANRAIVAVGLSLSTSCLAMRIYTKAAIMKKFWWDDVCIIGAWMLSVGTQATILYGYASGGIGYHIVDLSPPTIKILLKVVLAAAIIYIPCLAFAKLALLMLYFRLLNTVQAWRNTIYILAFIISAYSIALPLSLMFACSPIQKSWDITITWGSCVNRPALYLATAITNTVSDLVLISIPVWVVRGLRMRLLAKLGVILMLGIGCLTIVTSILRLATLWPLVTSPDLSYKIALASIFINIEANFIIICGSLPYLRQFARYYATNPLPGSWIFKYISRSSSQSTSDRTCQEA